MVNKLDCGGGGTIPGKLSELFKITDELVFPDTMVVLVGSVDCYWTSVAGSYAADWWLQVLIPRSLQHRY